MSGTGRRWLVLAGLAVAAFVTPLAALAADMVVTKTADTNDGVCDADCSLREAIDSANANDTIVIPAGTFTVDSELVIDKSLILQGGGQFDTIVQAAASPGIAGHRIFNLGTNFNVALLDMTIRHGALFGSNNGGAILIVGGSGTLDIIRCNVVHNEVNADGPTNGGAAAGGAIFSSGAGLITIRNSNIADNRATANGGELGGAVSGGAAFTGPVTIIDSSVVRNTISALGSVANGAASGGAFFSGVVILTNSTASLNGIRAGAASGGAFFGGPTTASSATVTDNFIEANAASGAAFFGTVTMRNSILAGNLIRGFIRNCFFNPTSAGYNLIDDATGCDPPAVGDQFGSSGAMIDPRLGPLALNGGTTETRALLFDSPAIDTANPAGCIDHNANLLTTDQRGFGRPFDGDNDGVPVCDIGAFEFRDTLAPAPAVGPLGLLALGAGLFALAVRRLRMQSPRA